MDEEIVARLDRIIFLLNLAFREQIESARSLVLADQVSGAIFDTIADDWVAAGELKRRVAAANWAMETDGVDRADQPVGCRRLDCFVWGGDEHQVSPQLSVRIGLA